MTGEGAWLDSLGTLAGAIKGVRFSSERCCLAAFLGLLCLEGQLGFEPTLPD